MLLAGLPAAAAAEFNLRKTERVLSELIESSLDSHGVPSVSIALVRGDDVVWTAAFGYANVRTRTPATPETIYSTGSTFKSVTAAAILQLQEQGKLALSHPVNRHLGGVRVQDRLQSDQQVTIEHVLSHWSGLLAGANTQPIWGRELPKSLEDMVSGLYSIRAPEAQWEYNNYAYGLAGLLIENVSGQEYEAYVLEHILEPLGVETPHPVYPSANMVEVMALPYMSGGSRGAPTPVDQVHFDVYPAGDIFLTAEDMAKFLGALVNEGRFNGSTILSEESVRTMVEPRFGGDYALGLRVTEDENGHTIIQHSGGIPGQSSFMMGDLDARVGVYYMSNSGAPQEIARAAMTLLRGEDYSPPDMPAGMAIDRKTLERYVGRYVMDGGTEVAISLEDDELRAQFFGSIWDLPAQSPDTFYLAPWEGTITFVENDAGVIDRFRIETPGQTMEAKRRE
jgi:CubicO group peptidase (beta-lactamase class C family)